MKNLLIPQLNPGDKVAIVAPSRHLQDPGRKETITAGKKILEGNFGLEVIFGKNIFSKDGDTSASPQKRAQDFNEFAKNPEIKMILAALGGDSANQILPMLDYQALEDNPKFITGFSDITHILQALHTKTGLTTYHGPNLSNFSTLTKDSLQAWKDMFFSGKINYPETSDVIKRGKAKGELTGGNLFVLNMLRATPYAPDFKDKILFWEEIDEGTSGIRYQLNQLCLAGVFAEIKGMIIGNVTGENNKPENIQKIIDETCRDFDFPVIKNSYFGHRVNTFYPIPIGRDAILDTETKEKIKLK